MRLLIVGPPGVGKGTQSAVLAADLGIPAISTGDMFRALQAADGELAEEVRAVMASGRYVDDDLTNRIVVDRLLQPDCEVGFLLDGYPRTDAQVDHLRDWLAGRGRAIDAVVALEADEEVTARRMAARAALDGRADDTAEAYRVRLRVYAEQTRPLLDRWDAMGLLRRVDGTGAVDEVTARIRAALTGARPDADLETAATRPDPGSACSECPECSARGARADAAAPGVRLGRDGGVLTE